MKKYIFPLFIFMFSFLLINNVNAKDLSLNFDNNDKFNYFYELKNNSNFYLKLMEWGNFINLQLKNFAPKSVADKMDNSSDYYIFVVKNCASSLGSVYDYDNNYFRNSKYTDKNGDYCFIWTDLVPSISSSSSEIIYNFSLSSDSNFYLFYFDSEMNFDSLHWLYNNTTSSEYVFKQTFNIDNPEYYTSFYYYGTKKLSINPGLDLNINSCIVYNDKSYFHDSIGYNNLKMFFVNLFSSSSVMNVDGTFLEYFKNFKYISSNDFLSLYNIVNYYNDSSYFLTSNYSNFTLKNDTEDGYYLIPNNNNSDSNEFYNNKLYYYTNNPNGVININFYDLKSNDTIENHNFRYTIKGDGLKSGRLYEINLKLIYQYICDKYELNTCSYSSFKNYVIYIYTDSPKYNYTFYYNTDYFNAYLNNGDITFNNPLSSNNLTLSYSTNNSFVSSNKAVSDIGLGIDNTDNKFNLDLSNISSMVKNFVGQFSKTIGSIFSLVFEVFSSLPSEVQQLFYFGLFGGIIILIYKILKG